MRIQGPRPPLPPSFWKGDLGPCSGQGFMRAKKGSRRRGVSRTPPLSTQGVQTPPPPLGRQYLKARRKEIRRWVPKGKKSALCPEDFFLPRCQEGGGSQTIPPPPPLAPLVVVPIKRCLPTDPATLRQPSVLCPLPPHPSTSPDLSMSTSPASKGGKDRREPRRPARRAKPAGQAGPRRPD